MNTYEFDVHVVVRANYLEEGARTVEHVIDGIWDEEEEHARNNDPYVYKVTFNGKTQGIDI